MTDGVEEEDAGLRHSETGYSAEYVVCLFRTSEPPNALVAQFLLLLCGLHIMYSVLYEVRI